MANATVIAAASRPRVYEGWPLLANSFRPFFLLGSTYAGLAVLVWLPVFYGELTLTSAFAPRDWHVHEMLYGYLPAVITGFLFTAIPNWTGRLPIQGAPLLALVMVWIAGRLSVTFSAGMGWLPAMLVDASFLALVAAAAAREIMAGRNWRNLNVVILVLLLLAGNVAFHLEAHFQGVAEAGIRIGIAVVVLLISLIGGRHPELYPHLAGAGKPRAPAGPVRAVRRDGRGHQRAGLVILDRRCRQPSLRRCTGACRIAASCASRALGRRPDLAGAAAADPACRLRLCAARLSA